MSNPALHLKRTPLATAVALSLLALGTAAAQAQSSSTTEAKDGEARQLDMVIVTSQGRKENALKIPYNISAINGDDLQERRITDQVELLREVSGAAVVDRGYRNSGVMSGVTVRGLNLNGAALGDYQTSAVPAVSTYVNQTPIYANFLIKDLERVEILRGPQGTLYGSGSLGGTLRYITNAPDLKSFGGRVEANLGKSDGSGGFNKSADLMLNLPLLKDTLGARLVTGKVKNAGLVDYANVYKLDANGNPVAPNGITDPAASYERKDDADTVDISYGRLSLLFKPTSSFSATLTYQQQEDDIGGRRQPTRGLDGYGRAYGKYENGSVQLEPSTRKVDMTALEMELDLGFATLTSATSHYEQTGSSLSENTGFYAKNNWLRDFYYNYPRPMAQALRSYSDEATVQELRLISKKGGSFDYIVGMFYQDQDLASSQRSYLRGLKEWADVAVPGNGLVNNNDFLYDRTQNFRETSGYGELTYHFSPTLRSTVGARFFDNKFSNDTTMGIPAWGLTPERSVFEQQDSGKLFKLNVASDITPHQMVYATVSQGYRRGGTNAVPLIGNFAESAAYLSYAPDTNTNYELGIKGTHNSLKYGASVFYIDWKDVQVETSTPNWGFYAAQNGGRARSQGLELELSGGFADPWRWGLNYTYVDAKLVDPVLRVDNPSVIVAPAGTRLPGVAKHTLSGSLEHTTEMSNGWNWVNRLSAYYQSETENAISASAKYKQTWPSFGQLGISSMIAAVKWNATFYVKNLLNDEGVTGGFLEEHMGTDPTQNYYGNGSKVFISQPRTIGVAVSYNF
jgi:iron complex outermembrane receptor protein